MSVRSYLRVLVVLVLLNDFIRAVPVFAKADSFSPSMAGYALGSALNIVAAVAALSGRRWGFVLLGTLTGLGVLIGLYASAIVSAEGRSDLATAGVLVCVAQLGIGVGLLFLRPNASLSALPNTPLQPTSGGATRLAEAVHSNPAARG